MFPVSLRESATFKIPLLLNFYQSICPHQAMLSKHSLLHNVYFIYTLLNLREIPGFAMFMLEIYNIPVLFISYLRRKPHGVEVYKMW